jgi:hypothetical protein
MGQNNGVDAARISGEARPVLEPKRLEALEQAAVDQDPTFAIFDKVFRAGDRPGATQERQFDIHFGLPALSPGNGGSISDAVTWVEDNMVSFL